MARPLPRNFVLECSIQFKKFQDAPTAQAWKVAKELTENEKDIIIGGLKFFRVVEDCDQEAKGSMQPPPIHAIRDRLLQGLDKDYNVISLLKAKNNNSDPRQKNLVK